MEPITWSQSLYRFLKSSWGIAIGLEAGFTSHQTSERQDAAIRIMDGLFYCDVCLPYPQSQKLSGEETEAFCLGLRLAGNKIIQLSPYGNDTLIFLRRINFSLCDVQTEGFTAAAMQWAGEAFEFAVTGIDVHFDRGIGKTGRYVYAFHEC